MTLYIILGLLAFGALLFAFGAHQINRARYIVEAEAIAWLTTIPGGFIAICSFLALFIWALAT